MLKAVIFDMDGVIIDSEPVHLKLEQKMFRELGINVTKEEHYSYIGTTSNYMWEDIRNKHGVTKVLEELVKNDRDTYFNHLISKENEMILIDGVKEFIKELHKNGVKLAIASSSPLNVIEAVAGIFGIDEYFDILVSGDYVEKSKPEPDIFLYAAKKLGVSPEDCIVVEDSHNGVLAAKKAGMSCIGYMNPASGTQDISMADLVVDCFSKVNCKSVFNLKK